jgi:hypothetical protein
MVWTAGSKERSEQMLYDSNNSRIGKVLSIESLQKYVLWIEKDSKKDKLKLIIEDRVNRYDLVFDKPHKDNTNENILYAQGEKGMMAKGPQLTMEIISKDPSYDNFTVIRVNVSKCKKTIFDYNIVIDDIDAIRLRRYIKENLR